MTDAVHYEIVPCLQFMTRDVYYYQAVRYVTKPDGARYSDVIGVFSTPEDAEAHIKMTAAKCLQYDHLGKAITPTMAPAATLARD